LLGLACGLVVNNILVVNNYRDVEEDRLADKKTVVVLFGRGWALLQYGLSLLFAAGVLGWFVSVGYGYLVLLGCLPLLFGFEQLCRLKKAVKAEEYLASLKGAALVVVGFSLLTSIGLIVG
jgi:1,4-dihydroxy-2-naphthoate octaprenyltransferase